MSDRKSDDELMGHAAMLLQHSLRILKEHAELLAIVRWCVEYEDECLGDYSHMLSRAKAAIAKAEAP